MATESSEEVYIRKGPPPRYTREKAIVRLITLFIFAGVFIGFALIMGKESLLNFSTSIGKSAYAIVIQTLLGLGMSVLLSSVQAIVLRGKIRSRYWLFILSAGIGGIIGGLGVGILNKLAVLKSGYITGFVLGFISGAISSLIQNKAMSPSRKNFRWFFFSIITWSITFGMGWGMGWLGQVEGVALGAVFILITMGVLLSVFLKMNSDIEFD